MDNINQLSNNNSQNISKPQDFSITAVKDLSGKISALENKVKYYTSNIKDLELDLEEAKAACQILKSAGIQVLELEIKLVYCSTQIAKLKNNRPRVDYYANESFAPTEWERRESKARRMDWA